MARYDQQLLRSRQLMFAIVVVAGVAIAFAVSRSMMPVQQQISGKLAATNRLWDDGRKPEAVEQYKQMIELIDNPFFGGQIKPEELPFAYGRIIDWELAAHGCKAALPFVNTVLDKQLAKDVEAQLQPKAKEFLATVRHGRQLQRLLNDVVANAKKKEDSGAEVATFLQLPFDASVCPEYSKDVVLSLDAMVKRIDDPALAKRLRGRLDEFR